MESYQHYIWQESNFPQYQYKLDKLTPLLMDIKYHQGLLDGIYKQLKEKDVLQIQSKVLTEDILKTSEIEGEILSRDSVRSSVYRRLGLDVAGQNHATAQSDGLVEILLDATRGYDKPLDEKRLFGWHAALFPTGYSGLHQIRVATYRGTEPMQIVSGAIGREKVHYEAPPRDKLEGMMKVFFDVLNVNHEKNMYIQAGIAHLWFVIIHPFDDGNGRMARAISDMFLSRAEGRSERFYSLSSVIHQHRKAYYEVLEETTTGSLDITAWLEWFLSILLEAQQTAMHTVEGVMQKNRFWQQHQDTPLKLRQKKVLNRLLDAGEDGFEGGMNTRKYASLTKCSKVTASRDLSDMLEKECLLQKGKGRSVSYEVRVDFSR